MNCKAHPAHASSAAAHDFESLQLGRGNATRRCPFLRHEDFGKTVAEQPRGLDLDRVDPVQPRNCPRSVLTARARRKIVKRMATASHLNAKLHPRSSSNRRMGRAKRNPSSISQHANAMGFAEPVIGRAFARPVGSTHPTRHSWSEQCSWVLRIQVCARAPVVYSVFTNL